MYSASDLKQDVLLNIKENTVLYNALSSCEFQFNDTSEFTRIIWNTFKRNLVIFCPAENRTILESHKGSLFQLCDDIHGQKDDFLLMSLEIMAKSALSNTMLTDYKIQINADIIIDRTPENEIGKGGFGKVYKYYDEITEEMYAYKIYDPSIFQESTPEIMKKRFIREGKKLLHYSHENVVKAYDFGFLGDESAFIKMEYIAGNNLIDYLTTKKLNEKERERLCLQYVSAMAYVHSKSDMHRDISYSNVMVDVSGIIKVLDFGFARGTDDSSYDTVYKDIMHKFAIPGEEYGMQTEVYCIGAILFSIATNGEFKRNELSRLDTCGCNPTLVAVIRQCLSENPEKRFADANAIQDSLISYESFTTINPVPKEFDLDTFRKEMFKGIRMYFSKGYLPNFDSVKDWLENSLKDIIESHTFLTDINLLTLLRKLPHLDSFLFLSEQDRVYDKEIFKDMYNYYNQLEDKMKSMFVKSVLIILLENSYENEELPFN